MLLLQPCHFVYLTLFVKWIDQFFNISPQGSTIRTEILAGMTTFAAMAYILVVNPSVLSEAGCLERL